MQNTQIYSLKCPPTNLSRFYAKRHVDVHPLPLVFPHLHPITNPLLLHRLYEALIPIMLSYRNTLLNVWLWYYLVMFSCGDLLQPVFLYRYSKIYGKSQIPIFTSALMLFLVHPLIPQIFAATTHGRRYGGQGKHAFLKL
ncbi:hypothetical protein L596_012063 [Steinernema carpocapsae]|uniref:Uncharacterized protein n=1 Tax=Steinernema carpocapsae TaxID=34508 RepID=A0A4U5NW60_STECR|nr:hypothetical protein L596_012063 [Steinernema carpocapsae]